MNDIIEAARSAGVHPLATSEEYLPGLQRFAAVFQQEHAAHIYRLREEIMQQVNEMYRLRQQRDALLEALKRMASIIDKMGDMPDGFIHPSPWQTLKCEEALTQARAAIAKAEGEGA